MTKLMVVLGTTLVVLFAFIILLTQLRAGIVTSLDVGDTSAALFLWAGAIFIALFAAAFAGGSMLLALQDDKEGKYR